MALTKFSGSEPRLLLLSVAALIMLSAAVVTQELRQCYWCGPLADQVHRSARAPACDAPNQVTTCDPGLDYCAVVATAPPYIESRYCVKNYRNDCYPLYCNSTRAWKMICPCKDNLCNGPNTEREKEAFATLLKLVKTNQNKRITKRTGPIAEFIKSNAEKTKIITNISGIQENMLNGSFEEKREVLTEIILSSESAIDNSIALQEGNSIESTTANDIGATANDIEATANDIGATANDIEATANDIEDSVTNEIEETTMDDVKLADVESIKDEILPVITTNVPQMSTNIQRPMVNRMSEAPKPSEVLPTAEALQQNASPSPVVSEKATEPTTTVETTTVLTTAAVEKQINQTIKKNGDLKINSSIILIVFMCFFVHMLPLIV